MPRPLLAALLCLGCASEPSGVAGVTREAGVEVEPPAPDAPAEDLRAPPPEPGAVRFVAFNVRRLFDDRCDTGTCGATAYEEVASPTVIAQRTQRIASAFARLRADVACVEEVETAPLLDAIADALPSGDAERWSRVLGETDAPASVDVGLVSRFPIREVRRHRDRLLQRPDGSYTNFARELLEVRLDVRGREAIVFCAHFRSKNADDAGRRWAEAVGARDVLAEVVAERPSALVLLGGDLNDVPGSPPLLALEERLTRVSAWMPDPLTGTYSFAGKLQAIDHFYVPHEQTARYVRASFRTVRDPGAEGLAGSDHAAIVADFAGFPR